MALVVGAAGFLGSSLVDELLKKGIQVIGVDNLSTGFKQNLENAVKDNNFHFIVDNAQNLELDIPRLDYVVLSTSRDWNIDNILKLLKKTGSRCLLLSSIELYDRGSGEHDWLKKIEAKLAAFAKENNLNARVLRLGPVYGPRMHFQIKDPLVKLIQQALREDLQKEVSLDFSTRALYIEDALDLMVKSLFSGATAQKIFDGVLSSPIKVAEIKQILLDPLWYEERSFSPQSLPPWPTPNSEKTIRFLNWRPRVGIVKALRETLSYFKDHELKVPEMEDEKKEQLQVLREEKKDAPKPKTKRAIKLPKFKLPLGKIYLSLAIGLIFYALIWPAVSVGWAVFTFRYQLLEAAKNLGKGEFDKSLINLSQAEYGLGGAKNMFKSLAPLRKMPVLDPAFSIGDGLSSLATYSILSAKSAVLGVEELYQGLRSVTGEETGSPKEYFEKANLQLTFADEQISKAYALLNTEEFKMSLPAILKDQVDGLESRLSHYRNLVKNGRAVSVLLPGLVAWEGAKSYLVLLQNNMELRPAGGFIGSYALITFEGGKLKRLDVEDIYAIDGQLNFHVEPPKEIREDLGQKDWYLRDANWEPDFPTSARQSEWFYNKETGERVEGVLALDVSAMENLLETIGPLDLPDYNEKITADNLFEKAIAHAELSFFPGSQAKKNFLTALTSQLFNKLIFVPNQNWPGIVASLGKSLEEKHMSIYLDHPKLFSYLVSQGWTNAMPRAGSETGGTLQDFLAPVEANLGANKANYYLERNYRLETVVGKDGDLRHRLRIGYINKSPSNSWPAGKYKNRMRVYLPFGAKIVRVLWGESDITKDVESFVDYGRSGYSFLISLSPKEAKSLVLDYEIPTKLDFKEGKAQYRLDVIKQAGTLQDPFEWSLTYPLNYSLSSQQGIEIGPQEQSISTDLSRNRSFEVVFNK